MEASNAPSRRPIALVTGANSGVGLALVQRLLITYGAEMIVIMACRNPTKAESAREFVIESYFGKNRKLGLEVVQLLQVDLTDLASVQRACQDFRQRFNRLDLLYCNAGYYPVLRVDWLKSVYDLIFNAKEVFSTGGDCIIQNVGETTKDGLGTTFAANVLGHYVMIREMESHLSRSGHGRIIWTSSTSGEPEFFSLEDPQCLKGDHPYESSKRATDLLSITLNEDFKKRGIKNVYSLLTSPGNVLTNMTQGAVAWWLLAFTLHLGRLLGFSCNNITPWNGCTALLKVTSTPHIRLLDVRKKYHSETSPFGVNNTKPLAVPYEEKTGLELLELCEDLRTKKKD